MRLARFFYNSRYLDRKIVSRFTKKIPTRIGTFAPLLGWMISGVLAHWAYEFSKEKAIVSWKQNTPPGLTIWKPILESRGYRPLPTQPAGRARLLQLLPTQWELIQSVWSTADLRWIAIVGGQGSSDDSVQEPQLFERESSRHQKIGAVEWRELGSSWDAIPVLIHRIEQQKPELRARPRRHVPGSGSLEIRY